MPSRSTSGAARSACCDQAGRVVFEPGQPLGAVHPDAPQEPDLADRRADVLRQPGASGQHQQDLRSRRAKDGRHEHDRADVRGAEDRPRQRVPECRRPSRRTDRSVPAFPRRPAVHNEPRADAGHTHVLAGRGRRGDREQVAREPRRLRATLLGDTFHRRAPRRGQHRGQRKYRQKSERWMDRHQQHNRDRQPENPPAGREDRHVHVVEHEDLVPQDREPVEVLGALVVGDRRHRRLQLRHMRFERNRHLVAKPTLNPHAHRFEEPRARRRQREADGCRTELPHGQPHQPEGQQGIGQRGDERQHEGGQHQPGLVTVPEPAEPPHRRQGRRQRSNLVAVS